MSASQIKIMEPGAVGVGMNGGGGQPGGSAPSGSENERLVVITGQPANIQMAVGLLYHVGVCVSVRLVYRLTDCSSSCSVWNRRSRSKCYMCKEVVAVAPVLCVEVYFSLHFCLLFLLGLATADDRGFISLSHQAIDVFEFCIGTRTRSFLILRDV